MKYDPAPTNKSYIIKNNATECQCSNTLVLLCGISGLSEVVFILFSIIFSPVKHSLLSLREVGFTPPAKRRNYIRLSIFHFPSVIFLSDFLRFLIAFNGAPHFHNTMRFNISTCLYDAIILTAASF